MCSTNMITLHQNVKTQMATQVFSKNYAFLKVLVFLFTVLIGSLSAQTKGDDYNSVKMWNLPKDAIEHNELTTVENLVFYRDKAFSGWAYERYPNGQLLRATQYLDGKQEGLLLMWYPDGAPQMSAAYKKGVLHGRFLGWYMNGSLIYDMVINKGTYAGDNLAEGEDGRVQTDRDDSEREGGDNDNSPE